MIEADYPPGTLIFVDNGYDRHGMTTPIRHKLAKVTHIVPTDPFLDKPIIEIDLSKIPDYAQEILYMKEEIEERREDAWDEQERIQAAAAAAVHVPVPRGGSPGFRPSRFAQFQTEGDIPLGRVFVPQGGRKSRRGRKSKKSRKSRSKKRRSNRRRRR